MNYNSQIAQDAWVHSVLGDKQNGFFVELGAYDGIYISNTLFFERQLGWNGICIEPNDKHFEELRKNRNCHVSNGLVYSEAGIEKEFSLIGTGSGIVDGYTNPNAIHTNIIQKITTTLADILDSFNAPKIIDYLSLDVEGHEYDILSTFPFSKYKFNCITVEHNAPHIGPENQIKIRYLLESNGYKYVKGNDDVSNWGHGPIDDFYVLA